VTYRTQLVKLAGRSERQAVALLAAYRAGRLDRETFVAVLAALVAGANTQAAALADLSLSASVSVALRRPVAPLGLLPPDGDADRLLKAAGTLSAVLEATPDPEARVGRLARAEPLETAARAYSDGMARSGQVTGWTRSLSGGACQLCTWWARDGRVWPADHPMPTHKGCTCTPEPTVTTEPVRAVTTRRRTA